VRIQPYSSDPAGSFTPGVAFTVPSSSGPLIPASLESGRLSPGGRWLALGLEREVQHRDLLIVDVVERRLALRLSSLADYHLWDFAWRGDHTLEFSVITETDDEETRFHVYELRGPAWTGTPVQTSRKPVAVPAFNQREYDAREKGARQAERVLTGLRYLPGTFWRGEPGVGGDAEQSMGCHPVQPASYTLNQRAVGWLPYLVDPSGQWGTISPDRRSIAAKVDSAGGGAELILLRQPGWKKRRLLKVSPPAVRAMRFWGSYLAVCLATVRRAPREFGLPPSYTYENKRWRLFRLDGSTALADISADLFIEGPASRLTARELDDALCRAVFSAGDAAAVRNLLAAGANPNAASGRGLPVIALAVNNAHPRAVQRQILSLLLDHGANAAARVRETHTTPLMWAAAWGDLALVQRLLDGGANPNARGLHPQLFEAQYAPRYTPLMLAAEAGFTEVVRLLLTRGARVNAANREGETALGLAVANGHRESVALLLTRGADSRKHAKSGPQ
jgi:hypothetical protein